MRSAIIGGEGSQLAQAFLQRGISVVQEHPVHPDEITRLQSLAEKCIATISLTASIHIIKQDVYG